MLENLETALRRLAPPLDEKALKDSMSMLQGYSQSEVSRSLDLTAAMTPGTNGSSQTSSGSSTPTPSGSPALPALDNKVGIAAQDLLTEQVDLSYQIVNLQLLLERAESDRYWASSKLRSGARMQAVLGFQISINPPPRYKGCAAVVEVTVGRSPATSNSGDVSLVALLPQEKTYNAATLATKSNSFGGAAAVKIFTIGYSEKHKGSNLYLYRDSDTVAFERPGEPSGAASFGWQFRPVLDRPSVDAGFRQVFAVVALPDTDLYQAIPDTPPQLSISTRTYWVKYDRKNRVAAQEQRSKATGGYSDRTLTAYSGSFINKELSPTVKAVTWHPVGPDSVLIDVQGDNLFDGSSVLLGGKIFDRKSSELVLNSDQHFQLIASASAVARSEGVVSGRYGVPAPLMSGGYLSAEKLAQQNLPPTARILTGWCTGNPDQLGKGIDIVRIRSRPNPGESSTAIEILLSSRVNGDPAKPELCGAQPLVTVGDLTIRDNIRQETERVSQQEKNGQGKLENVTAETLKLIVQVPNELLTKEQFITVKVPFLGPTYESTQAFYPTSRVDKVTRTMDSDNVILALSGTDFAGNEVRVWADRMYTANRDAELKTLGSTTLLLTLPKDRLKGVKHLIVKNGSRDPVLLPLTAEEAKPPKPTLADQRIVVTQNSATAVKLVGSNLKAIVKVAFEGKPLAISKADDGKSITVFLTRDITRVAGVTVDLLLYIDADTVIAAPIEILKPSVAGTRPKMD